MLGVSIAPARPASGGGGGTGKPPWTPGQPTTTPKYPTGAGGGNDPGQKSSPGDVPGMTPDPAVNNPASNPWYQWQQASDALSNAQYSQRQNELLQQRALLQAQYGRSRGGNSAAYNAGMQALASDRARLAADQALAAKQREFALTNMNLSNRTQHAALMSDAVSRGADTATGVAQNYGDITDKNQLIYDQAIAQADRNDAYLTQLSKDYGIKETQLKAALSRGAAAYGMSYAQAMTQIDNAMNSNDLNRQAAALQTVYQILAAGGTLPAGSIPGVGTGGSGAAAASSTAHGYSKTKVVAA